MQIRHVGDYTIKVNSQSITLKDILIVPSSSKNLLSIKKLCNDNQVWVGFDSNKV